MSQPASASSRPSGRSREATADREIATIARALGHPARVAILRHLIQGGECICGQIVNVMPLAQATVSQHLKVLKDAGLVHGEIDGPRVCYCANPDVLARLRERLASLIQTEGS